MTHTLTTEWHTFNKTNVKRIVGGSAQNILAVRLDGRGYYGWVSLVTDEYIELSNGEFRQNIYFSGAPIVFAVIEDPPRPSYKMAQPRLRLDDPKP